MGREPEAAVYASMRVHPLRLSLPFLRMMSLDISKAFERDSTSMNQRWFFLFVPMRMVLSREGEQMFLKVVVFMICYLSCCSELGMRICMSERRYALPRLCDGVQ